MDTVSCFLFGGIVAFSLGLVYTLSEGCRRMCREETKVPLLVTPQMLEILRTNPGIVKRQRILLSKINRGTKVTLRKPETIRAMMRTMFENPELLKEQMDIIDDISNAN